VLLVAAGVLAGSLLAQLTGQALRGMIWGVKPTDPLTFLGVAAIFLPALRVARLDPAMTLRSE
jgi:putative ABC transport system permease protein